MKRNLLIAASAMGLVALAAPAFAQSGAATGTVGITGNVTAKCFSTGDGESATFGDTMALGEIDGSDGHILPALAGSTATSAATKTFTITCTGVSNNISVTAQQFKTGSGTPQNGTANTLDYTAEVDVGLAQGGPAVFTATPSAPVTNQSIGGALSALSNNLTVKAYSFAPAAGTGPLLVAGSYLGEIDITIAPAS